MPLPTDLGQIDDDKSKKLLAKVVRAIQTHSGNESNAGNLVNKYVGTYSLDDFQTNLKLTPDNEFKLGIIYRKGYGIARDNTQTVFWYKQAADAGNSKAQANLDFMYYEGLGVDRDYEQARYWYQQVADARNSQAQYNLAGMYYKGIGVSKDKEMAENLFKLAADQGHTLAKKILKLID